MSLRIHIRESSTFAWLAAKKLNSNAVAIVYRNTIYLWGVSRQEFLRSKTWVAHEVAHVKQFKRFGTVRFTCFYLWDWMTNGYYNNRFEVESREAERNEGLTGIEFV